ncbi:hypothetical protein PVK06_036583 [Gossypium arboreum]|uniref:DUF4283 domain-containing protein n=1 Tax=Gossypium arboreum TaxID=29729 RepID=A0ABR0NJY0_GOSAR|nr:hypothetical protein PVK06_036583 [Gossypium arboreum]
MASNGKMEKKEYEKLKDNDRVESGECSSKSQFGMTNAENDNVRIDKHFIAIRGHVEEERLWRLQRYVVGEIATYYYINNLQERIVKARLGEIRIRKIQGRFFLVDIPDEELFGILKQNDWGYLQEFFVSIEPWSKVTMVEERVAWIEVVEVPLHCWNYESFKRIAGVWGGLISLGKNLDKASFSSMPMLVNIMKPEEVDCLIFLEVESPRFPVRVVESGLSKVKDVSRSLMGNNKSNGKNIELGRAEFVVSKFESVFGLRSDKLSCGERDWEEEAINAMFIEKQNVFSLEKELFGTVKVENNESENDFYV